MDSRRLDRVHSRRSRRRGGLRWRCCASVGVRRGLASVVVRAALIHGGLPDTQAYQLRRGMRHRSAPPPSVDRPMFQLWMDSVKIENGVRWSLAHAPRDRHLGLSYFAQTTTRGPSVVSGLIPHDTVWSVRKDAATRFVPQKAVMAISSLRHVTSHVEELVHGARTSRNQEEAPASPGGPCGPGGPTAPAGPWGPASP
jgi:hypothetical protein